MSDDERVDFVRDAVGVTMDIVSRYRTEWTDLTGNKYVELCYERPWHERLLSWPWRPWHNSVVYGFDAVLTQTMGGLQAVTMTNAPVKEFTAYRRFDR